MTPAKKIYLGDGCYATFDGFAIWLTTEDGISVQNRICLEPEVYFALVRFVERLGNERNEDEARR